MISSPIWPLSQKTKQNKTKQQTSVEGIKILTELTDLKEKRESCQLLLTYVR